MVAVNRPIRKRPNRGSAPSDLERDIAYDYRRIMGAYLREARLKAGMTQADVAAMTGQWYTAVSAIEVGRNAVPPDRYEDYVKLFNLDRKEFGMMALRYSNPWLFVLLYGPKVKGLEVDLEQLPARAARTRPIASGRPD